MQTCDDPDATSAINVYPADASAEFRWQLSQPLADPQEGSQGGTKMTYSLVKDLVISLPLAPCAAIVLDSEELAKGVCVCTRIPTRLLERDTKLTALPCFFKA